jgi:predicted DNA-binding transcriptional regulator AlpA
MPSIFPPGDELIPDPQVLREFNISAMTLWRWDHDPDLDFPPPIKIRRRKFRSRQALDEFKMTRRAIEQRAARCRAPRGEPVEA